MIDFSRFAYVQARLQARHGARPTDTTWRMLQASRSLGHYLDTTRQTSLGQWVTQFSASTDTHTIESDLRREWRALVDQVASWAPTEWRAAIAWTSELADLPFQDRTAHAAPLSAWTQKFRALWPACDPRDRAALETMLQAFTTHADTLDAPRIQSQLTRIFRRSAQRPPATFAFLGLMALDVVRLRAGLVRRTLFPEMMES